MAEQLLWGDIEGEDEELTKTDIENAESMGRMPPMRFLGTCESSNPREAKLNAYTCYSANLKWIIDELLECPAGTPASDEDKDRFEGRFQFDDVLLGHQDEKAGIRNRRILIAKRCGLINNASDKIPKNAWSDLIVGAQAIITTEKQEYTDKNGNEKSSVKVKFDGYESIAEAANTDSFDDI